MSIAKMKNYKVASLRFDNDITGTKKLSLTHNVSYGVKHGSNGMCEGELKITVRDKDEPEIFGVELVLKAVFEIKGKADKEHIHVATFKEIFPLGKSIVTAVTATFGVPPIIVNDIDIENQEIYRWSLPKKPEE